MRWNKLDYNIKTSASVQRFRAQEHKPTQAIQKAIINVMKAFLADEEFIES